MNWLRELWCWIRHGGHVYDDGPSRPANECFWCGRRKPGAKRIYPYMGGW
jgi:hypothetical protein